ncbi:MAG: dephospho-CoA kinase, partial [Gammaproteobacteria bacterium]
STVCKMFADARVPVIDADEIAHYLTGRGKPGLHLILESFGPDVITDTGDLDRPRLRNLIFNDDIARTRLDNILHPLIYEEIDNRVKLLNHHYCIICIPLLIEKQVVGRVGRILVVDATEEQQILRSVSRDQTDKENILRIMRSQTTRANRLAAADDIIHNDGDLASLQRQVTRLNEYYNKISAGSSMTGPGA